MVNLTKKEVLLISILIDNEKIELEMQRDGLKKREDFSSRQKRILTSMKGNNYFKTKTALKKIAAKLVHIEKLSGKFEYERATNG